MNVTTRNIEIVITALEQDILQGRDAQFGHSLVAGWEKYGRVTPNQEPWLQKLADKVSGERKVDQNALAIVELLHRGKGKLKFPKLVFVLKDGSQVRLGISGPKASAPGSVNLTGRWDENAGKRTWYGRIELDGAIVRGRDWIPACQWIVNKLLEDPIQLAKTYGQKTGFCCFCAKQLTDERSTSHGYGPVCAKHYNLPWSAKS